MNLPSFVPVRRRIRESADVVTLELPADAAAPGFAPGQFNMLSAFGTGEVAISISGDPAVTDRISHTIRAVGPVSRALARLRRDAPIGVRGPFGSGWPVAAAAGADVLLIAGGIGLAPLRPVLYRLLRERARYGRVALLYGARQPDEFLYRRELETWRGHPDVQLRVTVDRAGPGWTGDVGVVTAQLPRVRFDPAETFALVCGPELMIRASAAVLEDRGVPAERIYVSLERNLRCAVGWCGHCQFGPHFVCRDGPVFRFDRVRALLALREI